MHGYDHTTSKSALALHNPHDCDMFTSRATNVFAAPSTALRSRKPPFRPPRRHAQLDPLGTAVGTVISCQGSKRLQVQAAAGPAAG